MELNNKYLKYKTKYLKLKNKFNKFNSIQSDSIQSDSIQSDSIQSNYFICNQTWQDYQKFISDNIEKNCLWIYNILDKKNNIDKILYENDNFILIADITMEPNLFNSFHLLAFPKNKLLRTMRDLTFNDIPLLEDIISKSKQFIISNFPINLNEIEAHFHYPPTVMLLHIHFELVNNGKCRKPLKEYPIHNVIENLKIDSDYYKKINLQIIC